MNQVNWVVDRISITKCLANVLHYQIDLMKLSRYAINIVFIFII